MDLVQSPPRPPWPLGWQGEAPVGREEPPTPTPAWPPAGSASRPQEVPGQRAGITAASTEAAAGKSRYVQVVVSGWVSKSRPRELRGRLGTGRGPCGSRAASPCVLPDFRWRPAPLHSPVFLPEPQKNHSHHLGKYCDQRAPGKAFLAQLDNASHSASLRRCRWGGWMKCEAVTLWLYTVRQEMARIYSRA